MRYLSPSALNTLMEDPRKYEKRYITFDEDKELPTDRIVLGSLIHAFLADMEPLRDKNPGGHFLIADFELPSDTIQDILWCYYYNTYSKAGNTEIDLFDLSFADDNSPGSVKLLDLCRSFRYYQHVKKDQTRLDQFKKNNGDKYFEHLKKFGDRVNLITQEDYDLAKAISEKIKQDEKAREVINFESSAFEIQLKCDYNEQFGLKGILDNHWLKGNTLYLNDFKTTEKSIRDWVKDLRWDFKIPNQIAQYDYLLMENNSYEEGDVQVIRHIIYINQKTGDVYCCPVREETFAQWKVNWKSDLQKATWHFETGNFGLPHDFARYLYAA